MWIPPLGEFEVPDLSSAVPVADLPAADV